MSVAGSASISDVPDLPDPADLPPRLRPDLAIIPMPGAVQLRAGDVEIHVIRTPLPAAVAALLERMNGRTPTASLHQGIAGADAPLAAELVAELRSRGLIAAADDGGDAQRRYLGHFPNTRDVRGEIVEVTGHEPLAQVLRNVLADHGIICPAGHAGHSRQARACVCVIERPDAVLLARINLQAVRAGFPCLFIDLSHGLHATVGPFFIPGEGACHACFQRRSLENTSAPDELLAARRQMTDRQAPAPSFGTLSAYRHWVAGMAAAEIVALVSGHRPLRTLNQIVTLDLENLAMHEEPCWRIPWCDVCAAESAP